MTSEEFTRYMDIDSDLPVAADNTNAEICAGVQAAADSGESDDDAAVDVNDTPPERHTTFSDAV